MLEEERIRINDILRATSRKDFPAVDADTFRCHDCHVVKDAGQMYEVQRLKKRKTIIIKICYRCLLKKRK